MAKNLKLNIKNTQIAEAVNLGSLKEKLASRKAAPPEEELPAVPQKKSAKGSEGKEAEERPKEEVKRVRARSRSMFAEPHSDIEKVSSTAQEPSKEELLSGDDSAIAPSLHGEKLTKRKSAEQLRNQIFGKDAVEAAETPLQAPASSLFIEPSQSADQASESIEVTPAPIQPKPPRAKAPPPPVQPLEEVLSLPKSTLDRLLAPKRYQKRSPLSTFAPSPNVPAEERVITPRLGPTGRHIKDLLPPSKSKSREAAPPAPLETPVNKSRPAPVSEQKVKDEEKKVAAKARTREPAGAVTSGGSGAPVEAGTAKKGFRTSAKASSKEFRDLKPTVKRPGDQRSFDTRDRYGLRSVEEEQQWRKKRSHKFQAAPEDVTIRPTALKIRLPIALKDLANEMKLKASQLLGKLLMQGIILTLNDQLDDETIVQLLGQEFGCEITIDTAEQERIRITDKSVREEIAAGASEMLRPRAPVVAFMGHVDHGKTSLIDCIRKSNRVAGEAGAITQHIGAFRCSTAVGDIAILDTPGHEAFSAMRARGANVTDIVVLVIAGDEGIRQQTIEAIQHAKAAGVTIIVAINKCDKPNFNPDLVYRQLSEQDLLPEAWGGQIITVNCSAVTGEGVTALLEMLALQAEVLELTANPYMRARGSVLESEMHKGLGAVATILVQNGTLRRGDAVVFESLWGRIKTMRDEFGKEVLEAAPSTPVEITGLSGLPDAGEEFIVVKNEKEAREIAEARQLGMQQARLLQKRKLSLESLFQQAPDSAKKILNVILRADVQGSLEALRTALEKIESTKVILNIIFAGIGEVTESDVQLAAASKGIILGYHTQIENHAEFLIKELGVQVRSHDIIYHAIDDVKDLMAGLLDKVGHEEIKGRAVVRATFKSSQFGVIAGCQVSEGAIHRNNKIRVIRAGQQIWQGDMASLRRVKEDVREVQKGVECGIVLSGFNDLKEDDILEAFHIVYLTQQL